MIRLLIVDDSPVMRRLLSAALAQAADIQVVGTAADPYAAREQIIKLQPDVVTLDIEMPRMNGLTFLQKLMRAYPLPVIIVSSITPAGSVTAIRALEAGAMDVVGKPGSRDEVDSFIRTLGGKIRLCARAHLNRRQQPAQPQPPHPEPLLGTGPPERVLAIGASTGGTEAITGILAKLPADMPGTLIVQHLPAYITSAFCRRLNELSAMEVHEAQDGEILHAGLALVAPGDHHLLMRGVQGNYRVHVMQGPPIFHQRPSVGALFHSVAKQAGPFAVGVLLTGMGSDGAEGLLAMRQAGGYTLAQDEATSVVYGMPKAAADLGAAEWIGPLESIPAQIIHAFQKMKPKRT